MAAVVLACKASAKVNLLSDDTYRLVRATLIVSSFGQIKQGAHYIRKSLINEESISDGRVTFKFNEKSTASL